MSVGPEDFFKRLEESGLLNDSIVEQKDQVLEAGSAEDAAADLVEQKLLTKFQSEVLVRGDQIPLVVGDYVVTDSIGRGGMGYVLKARHRRMKREVAIKFLLKSLTESDELQRRFEREVEAAAKLDHQNIVTAYDAGIHEGSHFLVMQYVDGEDLSHLVKSSGPLEVADAVDVIRQAAVGLGYAHDRGVIHRDIKPGNLLLDGDGLVRILDMGLARIMPSPGDALEGGAQADLTNTGSVMGTIDYMAPEQALDSKSVDHRTDIYALGCTLYFLLTSNPPFRNDTVMRRLLAHREQPVPRISEYRPDAPSELDQIFAMMMAKSPDDRFPSMKHLVVALESLELGNSESEQMATLDMPDDGSDGFVRISDESALGFPDQEQTFVTPERSSTTNPTVPVSPGQQPTARSTEPSPSEPVTNRAREFDATLIEPSQQTSASADGGSVTSLGTDSTGVVEKSPPPWKLIVPGGVAAVALIAFSMTRPEPVDTSAESSPISVAASPDTVVPADADDVSSPDRSAAEFVLSLGGEVNIRRVSQQSAEDVDELPEEAFQLLRVQLSSTRVTDEGFTKLRGLSSLKVLSFWDTAITDQGLANLTDNGRVPLARLGIVSAMGTKISDQGIDYLKGSSGLYRWQVGETQVSDLEAICRNFPRISELEINGTEIPGEDLGHLASLPKLKQVNLDGSQFLNGGSDHVRLLEDLKRLVVMSSSEGFDSGVLEDLPGLEYLNLQRLTRDQIGAEFWSKANALPLLSEIFLGGWGVNSSAIAQMPAMKQLRILNISHSHVEAQPLANAVKRLPKLETLRLTYNDRLDSNTVLHLASLTGLKNLHLKGTPGLAVDAVESLHKSLPNCRIESDYGTFMPGDASAVSPDRRAAEWVLGLGGKVWIKTANVSRLGVTELSEIPDEPFEILAVDLIDKDVIDDGLKNLRGLALLSDLDFTRAGLTDRGLAALTDSGRVPLKSLTRLMAEDTDISDTGIGYLTGSRDFEIMMIRGTNVSSLELITSNFPRLKDLLIGDTKIPGESLALLEQLPRLANLDVSGTQFEGGRTHLAKLTNMRRFIVEGKAPNFTGSILANMPQLESLSLYWPIEQQLGDEFWSTVSELPKLKSISLLGHDGGLTSAVFNRAQSLKHLESLITQHVKADGSSIAGAVSKFPGLKFLSLAFGHIDDTGLKHFSTLTQVRMLQLKGCKNLSAAAVQTLHKALPNCRIESDHGVFEPGDVPAVSSDRRAAEWVLGLGGKVWIKTANVSRLEVTELSEIPDEPFEILAVDLIDKDVIDDGLKNLRGLALLSDLDFTRAGLTDRGLAALTDSGRVPLKGLTRLTAGETEISDTGIGYLTGSSDLNFVILNGTKVANLETIAGSFPRLKKLSIVDTKIAGESFAQLGRLKQLENLEVSGRQFEGGRSHISLLTNLRMFSVRGKAPSFTGSILANMPELESLTLYAPMEQQLGTEFWSTASDLLNFKALTLYGSGDLTSAVFDQAQPLEHLVFLLADHVTAGGSSIAGAISKFPRLKVLSLGFGEIDDAGLKDFSTLTQIRTLKLKGCRKLSAAAIQALHKALPNCRIESDHGVFEPPVASSKD